MNTKVYLLFDTSVRFHQTSVPTGSNINIFLIFISFLQIDWYLRTCYRTRGEFWNLNSDVIRASGVHVHVFIKALQYVLFGERSFRFEDVFCTSVDPLQCLVSVSISQNLMDLDSVVYSDSCEMNVIVCRLGVIILLFK